MKYVKGDIIILKDEFIKFLPGEEKKKNSYPENAFAEIIKESIARGQYIIKDYNGRQIVFIRNYRLATEEEKKMYQLKKMFKDA